MKEKHNQKIGFEFDKGRRSYDEHRQLRKDKSKVKLREVHISQACEQLIATGQIERILSVLGGGKEATVLLAQDKTGQLVCAKVFRYFTSTIRKRLRGTKHILESGMASLAARQEYWNLVDMKTHAPVPVPRILIGNIVVMTYITASEDSQIPAPLLRDVDLYQNFDPEEILYEALDILANLFLKAHYIHGDYSEHNLMVTEQGLVTMDVSQSVQYNRKTFIDTPVRIRIDEAIRLLEKDLKNVNDHFKRRYKIQITVKEVIKEIIDELPGHLQGYLKEKSQEIRPASLYAPEAYSRKIQYWGTVSKNRTGSVKQVPK